MSFLSWFTGEKKTSKPSAALFDTLVDTSLMLLITLSAGYGAGKLGHNHVFNPKLQQEVKVIKATVHSFTDVHDMLADTYKHALISLTEANALAGANRIEEAILKYSDAEQKLNEVQKAVDNAKLKLNVSALIQTAQKSPDDIVPDKQGEIMTRAAHVITAEDNFRTQTAEQLKLIATKKAQLSSKTKI
ncbi:MAG TPA: hypothetical protein VK158_06140 [Acidobacteriota bacterium]|nr:hypothetical protein [Acidobacteriota bacterium]